MNKLKTSKLLPISYVALIAAVGAPVFFSVLNLFYSAGDLNDPGWLARVAWQNNWQLTQPPAFNGSFLSGHLALIFWLTSLVSYVLPFDVIVFYGLFQSITYIVYATAIYEAWRSFGITSKWSKPVEAISGVFVSLLATFSAVGMQTLRLAHFELLIPAIALWFFMFLRRNHTYKAIGAFVLCLMVREDAGLHLFGIIFLIMLANLIQQKIMPETRKLIIFGVSGLLYALIAFYIKTKLPSYWDYFSVNYSGTPPWAHLTTDFLRERVQFYLIERTYIWVPLLLTIVWSIFAKDLLILVGYFSFIPWILISMVALCSTCGTMSYYYAFPFWFSIAWPIVRYGWGYPYSTPNRDTYFFIFYFLTIVASTVSPAGHIYAFSNSYFRQHPFLISDEVAHKSKTDEAVKYLLTNMGRLDLRTTAVDMAANGFLMDITTYNNSVSYWKNSNQQPRSIIYFDDAYEKYTVDAWLSSNTYRYTYQVPHSRLRVASQVPLEGNLPQPMPFTATSAY